MTKDLCYQLHRSALASKNWFCDGGSANSHPGTPVFGRLLRVRLPPAKLLTVDWQNLPVWVLRRSPADIDSLAAHEDQLIDPASLQSVQPASCRNPHRSLRPEIFVAVGLCTHQGCTPYWPATTAFFAPAMLRAMTSPGASSRPGRGASEVVSLMIIY